MKFPVNTVMVWKETGKDAYQKIDSDEWGNWRSLQYDLDKPLNKRFGFKWIDQQVFDYYNSIMDFKLPD